MWVSGKVQTTSSIPQMLNDLDTLHGSGLTVYPLDTAYALIDTSYINNHLFFCETKGSIHYFVSSDRINASTIINSPGCEKTMTAIAITKTAGGKNMFDAYPYEYRPPLLGADSIIVQVPTGYFLSSASLKNRILFNSFEYNSDTIGIPLTDSLTGTVVFVLSDLPSLNCLTQADTPSVANQTMWYGDQLNYRIIDMKLMPLTCDVAPVIAPDTTIKIRFDRENIPCMTTAGCALAGAVPIKQNGYNPVTLFISPGLNRTDTATTALAIKDTVCWDIAMNNFAGLSQADHVFIAILPDGVQNVLSGWHFYPTDSTVANYLNDTIVPITIALGHNSIITGKLCAVVNVCDTVNTIPINIHYGWNCGEWPQLPYDSTAVCGYYVDSLAVDFATVALASDSGKTYETPYILCDTIPVRTCFTNSDLGYVYPYQVALSNIHDGVTVVSGFMQSSASTFPLIGSPGDSLWAISDSGLYVLYPQNGGFTSTDGQFCLTLNLSLDCAFAGDSILPDKELFATTFCGDSISAFVNYTVDQNFVMNTTTSFCDACFTLEKFTLDTVAYTGTPITYNITACNFSADTNTVNIIDLVPPGFNPTSLVNFSVTLQSMECDTFAVTGTFSAGDTCPNTTNTALLIHNTDTISAIACVPVIDLCATTQITFTDSSYSHSYDSLYIGQSIFVEGIFFVDSNLTLTNCTVYVNAGGQIQVQSPAQLILYNTTIQSCDTMWRGIHVQAGAKLALKNNAILKDANIGIYGMHPSTIQVDSSSIWDCVLGVYTPPASGFTATSLKVRSSRFGLNSASFKPDYAGQPTHGILPKAGIEINNMIMILGAVNGGLNEFYKMNTGIVAHNSNLTVRRSKFYNIGYDTTYTEDYRGMAIVCEKPAGSDFAGSSLTVLPENTAFNTVNNCYGGVYTDGATFNINGIHILNVHTGVKSQQATSLSTNLVNGCTITASDFGIYYLNNPAAKQIFATNNKITITGINNPSSSAKPLRVAILMRETTLLSSVKYVATGDSIELTNAQYGIYAGALNTAKIKFNFIRMNDPGTGIHVQSNIQSSVNCNAVKSNYSSGITPSSIGICTGNTSIQTSLYCNTVDSTFRGFEFGGVNPGTLFKGNNMYHHFNGLYLNSNAIIGQQPHHGNRWNNTDSTLFGAVNLNSIFQGLQLSRFDVDSSLGPIYNPTTFPSSGWFVVDTSSYTFYCGTSTVCDLPPHDLIDSTLNAQIARGDINPSEYAQETRAIAEGYLYRELSNDSSLWISDSTLTAFMIENQGEPVAYLYDVEKYLMAAYRYDSVFINLIDSANFQIEALSDSIYLINEGIIEDPEKLLFDQYTNAISFLYQTIENLYILREAVVSDNLQNAELNNDMVVSAEIPELNTTFVNSLEIDYLDAGENISSVIAVYSELLAIAMQCPAAGGPAVERARTFVALVNDSINYDDDAVCLQSGIYKLAESIQSNTNSENAIIIHPNPASNKVEITLLGEPDGICNIQITDYLGKTISTEIKDCKQKRWEMDVSQLLQGAYTVKINVNNQYERNGKLIIVR